MEVSQTEKTEDIQLAEDAGLDLTSSIIDQADQEAKLRDLDLEMKDADAPDAEKQAELDEAD